MAQTAPSGALSETPRQVSEDKLEKVRDAIREMRDLDIEKKMLDERVREVNVKIYEMKHTTLPQLFMQNGVNILGIDASGNYPAYVATKKPFYKAAILADWAEDRKARAFAYLEKMKAADLIKTEITVRLGMGDRGTAKKVMAALKKLRVPASQSLAVPWNTLTSWVRSQIEDHNLTPDLDMLGAVTGDIVELKVVKQEN